MMHYRQSKTVQIQLCLFWCVVFGLVFYVQDYRFTKVLHFLGFISWFAGLFYLPRLLVYHVESGHQETQSTLMVMAYKLYYFIMNPAKNVTLISGLILSYMKTGWDPSLVAYWLHIKGVFVVILFAFHYYLNGLRQGLITQKTIKTSKFYRMINEVPTVLLIGIITMVVYKFS